MAELTIHFSGPQGSGKTQLSQFVLRQLRERGVAVDCPGEDDTLFVRFEPRTDHTKLEKGA